jgi:Tfp pilus assembly protein PilX
MTRPRLSDERGWVLVTATVLMAIMLSIGLAAIGLIDSDTHRTRESREAESSLNLDEGVLYAQSLVLAQRWPTAAAPAGAVCTQATAVTDDRCPSAANLAGTGSSANFKNVDQLVNSAWTTKVRDNGGALKSSYDPSKADLAQPGCALNAPCTYDANGDRELWVQAQSLVRGRPRNVVARLRLEQLSESTPQTAVTAGALSVTNNGNHGGTPIIDATGSAVLVRCSGANCVQDEPGQVVPAVTQGSSPPSMMTPDQLQRFKQRAITDGRYYPGCPTPNAAGDYDLSGRVVWIEGCASPPNLTNKVVTTTCAPPNNMATKCINTEDSPGILIWHCGRADFSGGMTYRGVLYVVNNSDNTCPVGLGQRGNGTCSKTNNVQPEDVLNTNGGFGVWGAVAIDGPGCLKVGSNGLQIKFDPRVFDAVESYGTVGLVQNTWRELAPKAI